MWPPPPRPPLPRPRARDPLPRPRLLLLPLPRPRLPRVGCVSPSSFSFSFSSSFPSSLVLRSSPLPLLSSERCDSARGRRSCPEIVALWSFLSPAASFARAVRSTWLRCAHAVAATSTCARAGSAMTTCTCTPNSAARWPCILAKTQSEGLTLAPARPRTVPAKALQAFSCQKQTRCLNCQ